MHTVRYEVIVIMPLTMAPSGSSNTVKKINGKDEIRHFLKSLGFVEEGRLRESVYTKGRYFDDVCFGMTREEFLEKYSEFAQEG